MKYDNWVLVRAESKTPVFAGESLHSFRGRSDGHVLTGGRPPVHAASTGRVYVEPGGEFFPSVFGLQWVHKEK